MLALGTAAPPFRLPDVLSGRPVGLEDFDGARALLVAFICNHCPYVQHVLGGVVVFARDYAARGLVTVAISPNDVEAYPQDAPSEMARLARERDFSFPYLYDESQEVALAYQAVCTPDFFLFDAARRLAYRGRFDGSSPGNRVPVTGADLRAAADALLSGQEVPREQVPSVGCSIKWKPGRTPDWA